MPVTTMKLDDLHITATLQPRGKSLCKDAVNDYTAAAKAGAKFPPLLAYRVTDRKFGGPALVAGFHRHKAFKAAELTECEVDLREGTFAEAWLAGFLSNAVNGLRYSREQKRHAVEQALMLFRNDSARQLAERLGVSTTLVSEMRKELVTAGKLETTENVTGSDGKEYRQHSSNGSGVHNGHLSQKANDAPQSPPPSSPPPPASTAPSVPTSDGASADDADADEREPEGDGQEAEQPPAVDPADAFVERVESLCRQIDRINAEVAELKKDRLSFSMHVDSAVAQIKAARSTLWQGRPCHACPYCRVNETDGCKACCMTKRVSKRIYDAGVEAVGGGV